MRQYSKLRMFLHAESLPGNEPLPGEGSEDEFDKRLVAFIRLGTDYQDNYYQIEIPLKPSEYSSESINRLSAEEVWNPDSNSMEANLIVARLDIAACSLHLEAQEDTFLVKTNQTATCNASFI